MKRMILIAAAVISLAGCGSFGESHDHNARPPAYDIAARWVRIQSPGNYPTIIRACVGRDGIYENTDGQNSTEVVPDDPDCVALSIARGMKESGAAPEKRRPAFNLYLYVTGASQIG